LTDRRVWADVGWLTLNSVFGLVVATVALSVTAEVVSLIVMPLWWWALSDPHHQYATLNLGIYTVTSTGWALLTTAIGLALAPVALVINRAAASGHSSVARRLLMDRRAR
jgi:Putative sensor